MSKNRNIIEGRILSFDKSPFSKEFDFSSLKIDKKRIFIIDGIIDSIEPVNFINPEFQDIEIIDYLTNNKLNFDYFLAADVFIYVGDLYEVFRLIKKRNQKIANLVFSIELTTAEDYILEKSGRYSHSTNYISSLCEEFDLTITNFKKLPIRKENKQYISGALYSLRF